MKLSEIVAYLNLLDTLNPDVRTAEDRRRPEEIMHVIENHPIQISNYTREMRDSIDAMIHYAGKFSDSYWQLKQELQRQVAEQEPNYLSDSLRVFEHEMVFESNEYVLNRRLKIDDESNILLQSKLRNLGDWRLPGLIFRPAHENFAELMVPLDPLYLVDQHRDLLTPAVQKFTPEYQRRLREYVINDREPGNILHQLPDNQFGLIFAYNYFNFKPLEILNRYLDEIAVKLRPGGTLLMTYNNCDRAHGVALAEQAWMMYQPRRLVQAHAEKLGLDIMDAYDGPGDLSWLELRRPGNITSLRGGQALAKIVANTQ